MENGFVLGETVNIGAGDAESDREFLEHCYIDTGHLSVLMNCDNPKCIIVGRVGSGKTALLARLKKSSASFTELTPDSLALGYVSDSSILKFFEDAGVSLDPFYRLLWQHILAVELLKLKFYPASKNWRDRLKALPLTVRKLRARKEAATYLAQWGDKFWNNTEQRIKEFATKIETELKANASAGNDFATLAAEGAVKLSEEQKSEVVRRGQEVVNRTQINDLNKIIQLLSDVPQRESRKHHYIIIDDLDENWVSDDLKFKLIQALLWTVRKFRKLQNVKVILTLRSDVYYSTLKRVRDSGFQRDKFDSNLIEMKWQKEELYKLLTERVDLFFRRQDPSMRLGLSDILPKEKISGLTPVDYLLDRTMLRPRYAILFVNRCLQIANGGNVISSEIMVRAESAYSQKVLDSLCDEWRGEFPQFRNYVAPFLGGTSSIAFSDLVDKGFSVLARKLAEQRDPNDPFAKRLAALSEANETDRREMITDLVHLLYGAGVLGVRGTKGQSIRWFFEDDPNLRIDHFDDRAVIEVHPIFWKALSIDPAS